MLALALAISIVATKMASRPWRVLWHESDLNHLSYAVLPVPCLRSRFVTTSLSSSRMCSTYDLAHNYTTSACGSRNLAPVVDCSYG